MSTTTSSTMTTRTTTTTITTTMASSSSSSACPTVTRRSIMNNNGGEPLEDEGVRQVIEELIIEFDPRKCSKPNNTQVDIGSGTDTDSSNAGGGILMSSIPDDFLQDQSDCAHVTRLLESMEDAIYELCKTRNSIFLVHNKHKRDLAFHCGMRKLCTDFSKRTANIKVAYEIIHVPKPSKSQSQGLTPKKNKKAKSKKNDEEEDPYYSYVRNDEENLPFSLTRGFALYRACLQQPSYKTVQSTDRILASQQSFNKNHKNKNQDGSVVAKNKNNYDKDEEQLLFSLTRGFALYRACLQQPSYKTVQSTDQILASHHCIKKKNNNSKKPPATKKNSTSTNTSTSTTSISKDDNKKDAHKDMKMVHLIKFYKLSNVPESTRNGRGFNAEITSLHEEERIANSIVAEGRFVSFVVRSNSNNAIGNDFRATATNTAAAASIPDQQQDEDDGGNGEEQDDEPIFIIPRLEVEILNEYEASISGSHRVRYIYAAGGGNNNHRDNEDCSDDDSSDDEKTPYNSKISCLTNADDGDTLNAVPMISVTPLDVPSSPTTAPTTSITIAQDSSGTTTTSESAVVTVIVDEQEAMIHTNTTNSRTTTSSSSSSNASTTSVVAAEATPITAV